MTFGDEQAERIRTLEARVRELEEEQVGQQVAEEKVKYAQSEIARVEENERVTRKRLHAAERRVSELESVVHNAGEALESHQCAEDKDLDGCMACDALNILKAGR